MRTFFCLALTVGIAGVGVSPAFAAKGVKKNPVNGVHELHGVVVHVHHHKGKEVNGRIGEITIKTHHKKKKSGEVVIKTATHELSVSKNTHFSLVHGTQHQAGSFGEVHDGEHVTIKEKDGHAESVAIHVHKIKRKAARNASAAKPNQKRKAS
jgi:hypothetical protein